MRSSTVQKHEGQISNFYFLISTFRECLLDSFCICLQALFSPERAAFYWRNTMLSNLINLLSKSETYLNSMVADKLGVGERMVKQMIHELERFGYVEKIDFPCCSSHSKKCTSHCGSANFAENRTAICMLTEKGRKAARKI
jgi:hypothetical protein